MPVYLLYGFRWPRRCIRYHVVLQNIDDAAPEWIVAPHSTRALLNSFQELYPDLMNSLPNLRFVEQYDASEEAISQPYAYIALFVHDIKLGADISDVVKKAGINRSQNEAFQKLKENLCVWSHFPVELGWYVVVCGDEERAFDAQGLPTDGKLVDPAAIEKTHSRSSAALTSSSQSSDMHNVSNRGPSPAGVTSPGRTSSFTRGIRRVFGGKKELVKSKSLKDLRSGDIQSPEEAPPLPPSTAR